MESQKETDNKRTIKHGAIGGAAGLLLGVPVLGIAVGVAYANKDKIKTAVKKNRSHSN